MQQEDENFMLPVKRYRSINGDPACAKDFDKNQVCVFYRTKRFGIDETCVFADFEENEEYLDRRDEGEGTLIPAKYCPIWNSLDTSEKITGAAHNHAQRPSITCRKEA